MFGLECAALLQEIDLSGNGLGSLSGLGKAERNKRGRVMRGWSLTTWDLGTCVSLRVLNVCDNEVESFDGLGAMRHLEVC